MPSPVAFVQGDDYAGGNPPLPSYVNTAAFESWYGATNGSGGGYGGSTFRHEYEFSNGNDGKADVDYFIDSAVKFNGHNTLKHLFGHDGSGNHFGAYHWSDLTDDGDPTETYPPNVSLNQPSINGSSHFPNSYWTRVIWKADAGFFPVGLSTLWGAGFEVIGLEISNSNVYIINRQGKIKLDISTHLTHGAGVTHTTIDVCDENVFVGRGDSLFGDLIMYYEGNEVTHNQIVKVWAGDQCSLAGVSPLVNNTVAAFGFSNDFLDISAIEMWNQFYAVASQPAKNLWVAGWKLVPGAIEANPWGVALT